MSDLEDEPPPVLLPCSICTRTFRPEVLERHMKICEKASVKKRRPFNSFKSRVSGTELEEFLGPAPLPGLPVKRPDKSPQKRSVHNARKWKETHETLIATLRAARGEADNHVNLNKHAGNEQCPSCGRYFGPRAFDRHVEFCKEKTARVKTTPSKASQAHERLEARTKYRAPLSLKPKLTTKEKYSPMLPRKADSSEICTPSKSTPVHLAVKTPKPVPMKASPNQNQNQFSRQSPMRTSQRQRSVSPTRKSLAGNSRISTNKNESQVRQTNTPKIKDHLKERDDFKPKTAAKLTAQEKIRNLKCKISQYEDYHPISVATKTPSRSKTRDKRVKHSDEESEEKRIKDGGRTFAGNLKSTSSRPIFQTDVARKPRFTKENKKPDDVSSDEETLSSKSVLSSRDFPAGESGKKNRKRSPLINDSSVNDESYGIFVSPCSFGIKPSPPRYVPPTPTRRYRGKKTMEKPEEPSASKNPPVRKAKLAEEIKTPEKTGVSKIPKPTCDHAKFNKFEKNKEAKPPDNVDSFKKDRERTATIKKKSFRKWQDLSQVSNEDLEKILNDFDFPSASDDFSLKNDIDDSKGNEEFCDSDIWEIAGEEFLKSNEHACKSGLDRGSESNKQDDIIVLHVADPSKLNEQDADPKLCMSEPCLSPCMKKYSGKVLPIPSDVIVFSAPTRSENRESLSKKNKKTRKTRKIRNAWKPCNVREKTFLANGYPQVKKRKLNSDEPVRVETDKLKNEHRIFEDSKENFSPENENTEFTLEENSDRIENKMTDFSRKYEYFEISKDISETQLGIRVKTKSPPRTKKFEYFEIEENVPSKSAPPAKSKVKGLKTQTKQEPRRSEPDCETRIEAFRLRHSDEEEETISSDNVASDRVSRNGFGKPQEHSVQRKCRKEATNNSLENIQEAEEEEFSKCIEIEDFIVSKPDEEKFLSECEKYLDVLFPKPKKISESFNKSESSTAVQLGFVVDSVYDLKSKERKEDKFPRSKKRGPKDASLPEIISGITEDGRKENSIMSLVEIWKNRKENAEAADRSRQIRKPERKCVKLAPLENKNRFQIREKKDENYDPFKQAERQMMALLSWPSTVDLKTNNETNSSSHPRLSPSRNLQTSPTSAFTKYPNKDGKITKDVNENLNRTQIEIDKQNNRKDETRTYTAADDWEEIFEKHFDLNRNDVSEKMTKSVKSALDGLLKKSPKITDLSNFSVSTPDKNKIDRSDGSVIKDAIYTSTPKSVKSDSGKKFRSPEPKPKTPSTYRKISGNVYGRISPPHDFGDSIGKENIENKSNRNSGISLSSLSFSSQVSDTTIADDEVSRNNLEIIGVATPRSTRRKFARSQSVFDERNKMLFSKTFDRNFSSSDENDLDQSLPNIVKKKFESKNPQSSLFDFPRSQSVADDRRKGDGDHSDEGDNVSSPEINKSRKAKMSGDSAYSSLNRKSPRPNVLPLNPHNDDRLSSSGSENSLPPLNNEHSFKPKSLDFDSLSGKTDQHFKMSKFCHECGSKYPVPIAKFCCECGVRRLII